jgi:acetoacetyl-CoA synthetase
MGSQIEPIELWRHPKPESTQMHKFLQHVKAKYRLDIDDYPGLYKWSVENVPAFWEDVWRFCGIKASKPYIEVGTSSDMKFPTMHLSWGPNPVLQ